MDRPQTLRVRSAMAAGPADAELPAHNPGPPDKPSTGGKG